jgi:hypothetical protein
MNSSNLEVEIIVEDVRNKGLCVNNKNRKDIMDESLDYHLFYYEVVCGQRKIKNINKIQIGLDKIDQIVNEIFTCSFCMNIFQDAVNLKNCLHKFCKKCAQDYFRQG